MTNSFDSLYENLISEMMPIDIAPDYEGTGEEAEATFSAGVDYALTPEQSKEVARKTIEKLRTLGGHSDKKFKEFQEEDIAPIVKEVAGINMTNAKFAARRIHTALRSAKIITDERDGTTTLSKPEPTEREYEEVADKAEDDVSAEEHIDTNTDFDLKVDYYIKSDDEIKAGTLTGDLLSIYNKIGGLSGETNTGSKIVKQLQMSGLELGKVKKYLKELINKGILESQANASGTSKTPEAAVTDRNEAIRYAEQDPEISAAIKDYNSSGGGNGYGVDFG